MYTTAGDRQVITTGDARIVRNNVRSLRGPTADHRLKVERICGQLRERTSTEPLSLRKGGVAHQVPKRRDGRRNGDQLDVSALDAIITIDPLARICVAEPGVPFDRLVRETMRLGLAPKVVPELREITVGGAVSGCSIESMSYRYGGFHDSCTRYELITAKGEVLTCTRERDGLLFEMMQNSFGTLGILSQLTFELVPAKPFVHVVYERYSTLADYQRAIVTHFEARDVDFMDGMVHAADSYVLSLGWFVDEAPYTHAYDWTRVYHRSTLLRSEDYLHAFDYFFRYDRGVTNVHPKSFIGRLLLGKVLTSSQILELAELLHRFLPKHPDVTLDTFIPLSRWPEFMEWHGREVRHFPLWMVPYKRVRDYPWLAAEWYAKNDDQLFIDLAIYGAKQPDGVNLYRRIEEELLTIGGMKTLISHNHYTPTEFWSIYNKTNYDAVKQRVDPNGVLRDLYEKMCVTTQGR